MGLDNYASQYVKRIHLSKEIEQVFQDAKIALISDGLGSLRGKSYHAIIDTVCDVNLYSFIHHCVSRQIVEKLNDFMQKIQLDDDNADIDLRNYIEDYDDQYEDHRYITCKQELKELQKFFQICADYQLYLHANY